MQAGEILEKARRACIESDRCRAQAGAARGGRLQEAHARRLQARISAAEDAMERAYEVIYGDEGEDLTEVQREILFHRYVCAEKWEAVARAVFYSTRKCQDENERALSILDGGDGRKGARPRELRRGARLEDARP